MRRCCESVGPRRCWKNCLLTGHPPRQTEQLAPAERNALLLQPAKAISCGVAKERSKAMPWELTGNSGTDPATNFLGTSDNQPLVIRTTGAEALRIPATGGLEA